MLREGLVHQRRLTPTLRFPTANRAARSHGALTLAAAGLLGAALSRHSSTGGTCMQQAVGRTRVRSVRPRGSIACAVSAAPALRLGSRSPTMPVMVATDRPPVAGGTWRPAHLPHWSSPRGTVGTARLQQVIEASAGLPPKEQKRVAQQLGWAVEIVTRSDALRGSMLQAHLRLVGRLPPARQGLQLPGCIQHGHALCRHALCRHPRCPTG
jgi:hypothetical protein